MPAPSDARRWTRFFVRRTERLRATWTLRIAIVAIAVAGLWLSQGWWSVAVARSLVCDRNVAPSDAILIENFDPDYQLFERAAALRRAGVAPRVLVPVAADAFGPNRVARAIAETMASMSRIGPVEIVPIREIEPISLNAALDVRKFAVREGIHSVIVVSPLFRSRRSVLVYDAALGRSGISVRCDAVEENRDVTSWLETSHGIQSVVEQWLKLRYYQLYVLPFRSG
jgi:hypothetical protein